MCCKLVTEKVVIGLPLSILWENTIAEWVILADNDFPSIIHDKWEWYLLQRLNSGLRCLLEIRTTLSHRHPALILADEPILVVTMPGVAETIKTVIDEMTHGTDFKLIDSLLTEYAHFSHGNLNTSIDELENRGNIDLVSYDTLTFRAKPWRIGRLSHCSWNFGIFD